jgi:hypothetical protein
MKHWLQKFCIFWTITCVIAIAFCAIHVLVIKISYAELLIDDVASKTKTVHDLAKNTTENVLSSDAISIAYQLGRLDFASIALTATAVILALAGFAAFAGIKATAIKAATDTTEEKILELIQDDDFANKINEKMSNEIYKKVALYAEQQASLKDSIDEQDIGEEFTNYLNDDEEKN